MDAYIYCLRFVFLTYSDSYAPLNSFFFAQAFPIVFTIGHHMNEGVSGLMYLPLPIGGAIAVGTYLVFFYPRFSRAVEQAAFQMVAPELRLEMAMVAGPIFAGSFFWFAWTSFPSVSFWAPLISVGFMGFSICLIFVSICFTRQPRRSN